MTNFVESVKPLVQVRTDPPYGLWEDFYNNSSNNNSCCRVYVTENTYYIDYINAQGCAIQADPIKMPICSSDTEIMAVIKAHPQWQ